MRKKLIKSYAKVNLSLKVLGRNKNKFHKIQSIISYLDIYDRIYINSVNKQIRYASTRMSTQLNDRGISKIYRYTLFRGQNLQIYPFSG